MGWRAVYDGVNAGVFGRAEELALVGAGCAVQPDGGVPDDDEEYSEPEVRNALACLGSWRRYSLTLWRGVISGCGST